MGKYIIVMCFEEPISLSSNLDHAHGISKHRKNIRLFRKANKSTKFIRGLRLEDGM